MKYIDLFAGAGGLSEGFMRAGFEPVAHVEIDQAACFTLQTRLAYYYLKEISRVEIYVKYLKGEITRDQLYSFIPARILESVINLPIGDEHNHEIFHRIEKLTSKNNIDLIVGGPPCQAYSLVGRARDEQGMREDPRNFLYLQYGRFLKRYKPKLFIFENVIGLLSAKEGTCFKNIKKYFRRLGYIVEPNIINANEYGVFQKRKRVIIVGWQKDLGFPIGRLAGPPHSMKHKVNSIFSDLPKLQAGEGTDKYLGYAGKTNDYLNFAKIRNGIEVLTQHITRPNTERDKEIYRHAVKKWKRSGMRLDYNELPERLKTHSNRAAFLDRYKVVADDLMFAQTVVAHIAKDGHYYIHPDIEQNRSISVREAARLQTFPDDYYFEGVKEGRVRTSAFKQIGNAVPPLMAEKIAEAVAACLRVN